MHPAAFLFSFAAFGGLAIVILRLSGSPRPPTWLAIGHGMFAVAGLIFLIYAALTQPLPTFGIVSLGMFVLAALAGITIFTLFHLRQKPLPIPLVLGHGAIAITAYVLLLLAIYG